jgi:signal transduction histidine kinase
VQAHRDVPGRFEQLLEFAPDAIVGVGTDGKIVLVNSQTEALFGYPRRRTARPAGRDLVPKRFRGVHPGHRAGFFADPRTRPMGAGLELFRRCARTARSSPPRSACPASKTRRATLAISAIRDVTHRAEADRDRRELAAELVQTGRVEAAALVQTRRVEAARSLQTRRVEADRARADPPGRGRGRARGARGQLNQLRRLESVGQLAGGIAHDFNNLLGIILNYAQFVADDIGEDSPAAADVEEIRRAAERAAALTRQLLIFSRREVVRKRVLDLNEVVSELDRLLAARSASRSSSRPISRPGCGPSRPTRPDRAGLVNLAVNARDAMPAAGAS